LLFPKKPAIGLLALLSAFKCLSQQLDLADKSLEDLMNIQVTTVSKKEQKLSRTAAAIFVITSDDIARSGATNVPDLLRMVPGVDVAQIDANTWAISARGLNSRFSNELLVMMDGRNLYTPTFGGVLWDGIDIPLEDIERIEVIRGPGGTIWGANAVNGVINIITKKAANTKGTTVVAGGGNLDQGFGTTQHGGSLGKNTDYRVSANYFNQDHMPGLAGAQGVDGWHLLRGGFRSDTSVSPKDTLTTDGEVYTGAEGALGKILTSITSPSRENVVVVENISGGALDGDWNHIYSSRSDSDLHVSFDRYKRDDVLTEARNTFSVDFQHHLLWGSRQDIVWGAGYRYTVSDSQGTLSGSLVPGDQGMQIFSLFAQDEVEVLPDKLYATVGTKLEHNIYTGLNLMPSVRISWTLSERQMFWAAVSRAERTPAEADVSVRANVAGFPGPGGIPVLVAFVGNPHFKDEDLIAYESGYRVALTTHLSLDLAAFYGDYSNQKTVEPGALILETSPPPVHLLYPLAYQNLMHGETHGLEIAVNWKATDRWTISPGYAFEQIHMHLAPTSRDTISLLGAEGNSPVHNAQLRSHLDLVHGIAWDASASFVDRLRSGSIPSYTRLDTGLTWRLRDDLSLSVVGQNLAKDRHLEFFDNDQTLSATPIKRSAYAKLTWHF
jgi:iron complex outermembrane receptor protein